MTDIDIFGNVVDAGTVEQAVKDTLQGDLLTVDPGGTLYTDPSVTPQSWLVAHLAHQERRRDLPPRTLPWPRSWPTVSDFDIEAHNAMPSIIIVSPGTLDSMHERGSYRTTWSIEVAVAVAGKDEPEARLLASLYLAAIKGALIQAPSLGGAVAQCRWVGPDDHAFGMTQQGGQRAIYATAFGVTVRDAVNARQGPDGPPEDPYDPPDFPPLPLETVIDITTTSEEA